MKTIEVPIAGSANAITVYVGDRDSSVGGTICAPDTRHAQVFVSNDRGTNFHGSLLDEYFVGHSEDRDVAEWIVMWLALNADQALDDVARLLPVALLSTGWKAQLADDILAQLEEVDVIAAAGAILLWTWIRYSKEAFDEDFEELQCFQGGVLLDDDQARAIVSAGSAGVPLDFAILASARSCSGGDK